jgi:hypothetical protein
MWLIKRSDVAAGFGYKLSFGRIPKNLKDETFVIIGKIGAGGF